MKQARRSESLFHIVVLAGAAALLLTAGALAAELSGERTTLPRAGEGAVRIEAENYKHGGQDVGYYDTTPGNRQGGCREGDVDLANSRDAEDTVAGCNLAFTVEGEWVAYDITAPADQSYVVHVRVATAADDRILHIEVDGVDVTGPISVPNTGGWQVYQTVTSKPFQLKAGDHVVRIVFDTRDINVNWLAFEAK